MKRDAGTWLWVLAAVVSAAILGLVRDGPEPARAITDIVFVGGGEAALVYGDRIELASSDGRSRWRASVGRAAASATPHARLPYVLADGERVYARAQGARGPVLVALARDRGGELWRSEPLADTPDEVGLGFAHDRVARALAGPSVVDAFRYDDGKGAGWVLLAASDRESGELRWRARLGPQSRGPMWVRGDQVIFGAQGVLHGFRADDGEPTLLVEAATPVCVFDDELIYAQDQRSVVSSLDGTRSAQIPVAEALAQQAPRALALKACGRHAGSFVLAVEADERTYLVSLRGPLAEHDGGFELRWLVELGAAALATDHAALAGELPRFLPLALGRDELVVVDLTDGAIAWRAALEGAGNLAIYTDAGADAGAEDFVLFEPARKLLLRLDGGSGRAVAAARIDGAGISAHHVDGDALWTFRGADWAVLDARTFKPRPPHEAEWVRPVSTAELGLPEAAVASRR
jgi:hypothetical protein